MDFCRRERKHAYFISAPAELSNHVFRQEFRVRPRNIHVRIGYVQVTVQHIFKFGNELYLVQQDVIHFLVLHSPVNVFQQCVRIAQGLVPAVLQVNTYDVGFIYAFFQQMVIENSKQQVGFARPSHSGNHFYQMIVPVSY